MPDFSQPRARLLNGRCLRGLQLLGCSALTFINTACGEPPPTLEMVRATGELRVATVSSATTYYREATGAGGFEHDLASAFALSLGLTPRFVVAKDYADLRRLVKTNRVHIGAALLPIGQSQEPGLAYGPTYAVARQAVICSKRRNFTAHQLDDLRQLRGAGIEGRSSRQLMRRFLPPSAGYRWKLRADASPEDLFEELRDGRLDYVVVPSFDFEAARNYFPDLEQLIEIGAPQAVAWLFRSQYRSSLWGAQLEFLRKARQDGTLDRINHQHFGHIGEFDYVDSRALIRHFHERLPEFRADFVAAGQTTGIDWRLLAAIAYQESHWQPDARSPTGVRGLMMLTRRTAKALNVDRMDPTQAILGAAKYLSSLKQRLPARIQEPERTWFALAAYNIGLGHLEDARVLTQRAGQNPDRWLDVQRHLPKLSVQRWAKKSRFGFARGYQAVHFVQFTRRYLATIRRLTNAEKTVRKAVEPKEALISPVF